MHSIHHCHKVCDNFVTSRAQYCIRISRLLYKVIWLTFLSMKQPIKYPHSTTGLPDAFDQKLV